MTTNRFRQRLSAWLHKLADQILQPDPMKPVGGKLLQFVPKGRNLGRSVFRVISQRGGMDMGIVEWSNQWGRPRFKAHSEAVFDQQCIAEIYACMREMK